MLLIHQRILFLISIISFDRIPELMRVPSASFIDTYPQKVTELMMNLVLYVQMMDVLLNPSVTTGTGAEAGAAPDPGPGIGVIPQPSNNSSTPIHLEKNANGYPILPDPLPGAGWKKTAWEALFTDYLGQQYNLASGGNKRLIPYKCIGENQLQFIDRKYLPRKTVFRSPRNIGKDEIKSIFDFLLERQRNHGPEDTFIFKSIKLKGNTVPSQYTTNINNDSNSDARPGAGSDPGSGSV